MHPAFIILGAIAGGLAGFAVALAGGAPPQTSALAAMTGAALLAGAGLLVGALRALSLRAAAGGGAGLVAGLLAGVLAAALLPTTIRQTLPVALGLFLLGLALGWVGMLLGATKAAEPSPAGPSGESRSAPTSVPAKILDTSVIIDGRIADLCETGFLEGALLVPQFVLRELQYIADSSDTLKRNRGRRGLDVLARMQQRPSPEVVISDEDFPRIREVDAKLIALAQKLGAKVVTNDFNLAKVAGLHGVVVLNLNQLANALKPTVLPGEPMRLTIVKEGKEVNQGIGYLDDGTMVVVDNARRFIGKPVEVVVSSALQTSAGRMIFAQLRESTPAESAS